MAFHLAAFWENIDIAGTMQNLAAVADQSIFTSGDDLRVPDDVNQIVTIAAMVGSGGTGRAALVAPSLRDIVNLDIQPINGGADADAEPDTPHKVVDLRDNPVPLETGESLNAQIDSNTTAAADQSVLVWLADGAIQRVTGSPIYSVRATAAITCVAGAWTNGSLTFAQTLPVGTYAIVGMRAEGATLIAARLVFRGSGLRPGCMGTDADTDQEWEGFRRGGLGVWGEFHSTVPPTVDVLANDADSAQEFILDLVKTG